jgi:superfamily I DNA/RNA helicase
LVQLANTTYIEIDVAKNSAIQNIEFKAQDAETAVEASKENILNSITTISEQEKQEIKDFANLIKENAAEIANRTSFAMFDTITKDHILTYEESKGLALQGTYVYKEAIAGSRYGYPDFYNKVVEEFNEATSTETVNGVTVKVHSNGHKFYDIAEKTGIDGFFDSYGYAWFYGVDTENERVFLPRDRY